MERLKALIQETIFFFKTVLKHMLLQAQASAPVKLGTRLNRFLNQDLSDSFKVVKAME